MLESRWIIHANTTAGTGKTRYIAKRIDDYAESFKVSKNKILYLTFTKMNVESARKRKVYADVRTIHSFAYRYIKGEYDETPPVAKPNFNILNVEPAEFNRIFKYNITPASLDEPIKTRTKDDFMLACLNYSFNANVDIETAFEMLELHRKKIKLSDVKEFTENWQTYKFEKGYIDFNDLIHRTIIRLQKKGLNTIKFVAIDEAQDLSPAMWKLIETMIENSLSIERVLITGDDDQTIYSFLNASNPVMFVAFPEVLANKYGFNYDKKKWEHKSFRCPSTIFEFAKKVLAGVKNREHDKKMVANSEGGEIEIVKRKDFLEELKEYIQNNKTVAIIERHNHNLSYWKKELLKRKISYVTKDNLDVLDDFSLYEKLVETIKNNERNDKLLFAYLKKIAKSEGRKFEKNFDEITEETFEKLFIQLKKIYNELGIIPAWTAIEKYNYQKPHVILSTIHAYKGEEADFCFVGANWTNALNPETDDEKRVYFVAFTRAKEKLILAKDDIENFEKLFC